MFKSIFKEDVEQSTIYQVLIPNHYKQSVYMHTCYTLPSFDVLPDGSYKLKTRSTGYRHSYDRLDDSLSEVLQKTNKPIILVANKCYSLIPLADCNINYSKEEKINESKTMEFEPVQWFDVIETAPNIARTAYTYSPSSVGELYTQEVSTPSELGELPRRSASSYIIREDFEST